MRQREETAKSSSVVTPNSPDNKNCVCQLLEEKLKRRELIIARGDLDTKVDHIDQTF